MHKSHIFKKGFQNKGFAWLYWLLFFRLVFAGDFCHVRHNWSLRLVGGQRTGLSLPTAFSLSPTLIWAGVGIDFHQGFLDRWFGWFLDSYAGFPCTVCKSKLHLLPQVEFLSSRIHFSAASSSRGWQLKGQPLFMQGVFKGACDKRLWDLNGIMN